ncbi:MAG: hypothetical protein ACTFAK_04785 [Candidatus Electronema sp. VV]
MHIMAQMMTMGGFPFAASRAMKALPLSVLVTATIVQADALNSLFKESDVIERTWPQETCSPCSLFFSYVLMRSSSSRQETKEIGVPKFQAQAAPRAGPTISRRSGR